MNTELDDALDASFPASDPPAATTPVAITASSDVMPAGGAAGDMIHVYRIVEDRKSDDPFGGANGANGAAEGRWTSGAAPSCVYASLSPAGAMLEFVAHLEGRTPPALMLAVARIPAADMLVQGELREDWKQRPYRADVQAIGDVWLRGGKSLALRVPSALCPGECNVLINPAHARFVHLDVVRVEPMAMDERIRI